MAQDVASVRLCARRGNARDGGITCHNAVVCAVATSCFATGRLGRRPLTWAQDQNAGQFRWRLGMTGTGAKVRGYFDVCGIAVLTRF